jgi:tripartite motif-containing protein 71
MRVTVLSPGLASARFGGVSLILAAMIAACGSSAPAAAPAGTPAASQVAVAQAASTAAATHAPASSQPSLAMLWEKGGPATPKSSTAATAIDPLTGNLWAAVPFENRYWIFSPDGKFLESWGTAGKGPGQLDLSDHAQNPDGWGPIAFAPDGSFVIGDTGNHRVQAFDAKRRFVRQWGGFGTGDGRFVQVTGVAIDGNSVIVADGGRWDVQVFKADGTFVRSFGATDGLMVLAVDAKGRVHAANPQNPANAPMVLVILGPDGAEQSRTDLTAFGGWPVSISVDEAGNSFVSIELDHFPATNLALVEIDPAGKVLRSWANAGGDAALVTPAGDAIYVTRGVQLDGTQWTVVRKYALPKP